MPKNISEKYWRTVFGLDKILDLKVLGAHEDQTEKAPDYYYHFSFQKKCYIISEVSFEKEDKMMKNLSNKTEVLGSTIWPTAKANFDS